MEKTTNSTTLGEIQAFVNSAANYLGQSGLRPSHLSNALTKSIRELRPFLEELEDLVAEKKIDLAQKDKDGVIQLHENGSYRMKADSAKKLQAAVRKIYAKEVKVTTYLAKEAPKNLPLPWYAAFIPFVIKDYPEPVEDAQPSAEE